MRCLRTVQIGVMINKKLKLYCYKIKIAIFLEIKLIKLKNSLWVISSMITTRSNFRFCSKVAMKVILISVNFKILINKSSVENVRNNLFQDVTKVRYYKNHFLSKIRNLTLQQKWIDFNLKEKVSVS
jgi:hypothetical protein